VGFDVFPATLRIAWNGINVQLERISARFLDLLSVSQPAAKRAAVEAPDDWDINRRFRPGNVLQVRFRPNPELGTNRKISQRFRKTFRTLLKIKLQVVVSRRICSSKSEWNTTAAAPPSSIRLMLSIFSESGDADGTSGVRSLKPRYLVVRFIGSVSG
jgi:hypothetical protein